MNKMLPCVLAALLLSTTLFAQEKEPDLKRRIANLVWKLDDESLETRDKAHEELRKIGEPALEALREAMRSEKEEVRARAATVYHSINWTSELGPLVDRLTGEEREFLKTIQVKRWAVGDTDPVPFIRAFPAPVDRPAAAVPWPEDPEIPFLIWKFLDPDLFRGCETTEVPSKDGKFYHWKSRNEKVSLYTTTPIDPVAQCWTLDWFPRYYLTVPLGKKFHLTADSVKFDGEKHFIPCLSGVDVRPSVGERLGIPGWHTLGLVEFKTFGPPDGLTGAFYKFGWMQLRPFPNLRYLFIKEEFVIFCIAFQ